MGSTLILVGGCACSEKAGSNWPPGRLSSLSTRSRSDERSPCSLYAKTLSPMHTSGLLNSAARLGAFDERVQRAGCARSEPVRSRCSRTGIGLLLRRDANAGTAASVRRTCCRPPALLGVRLERFPAQAGLFRLHLVVGGDARPLEQPHPQHASRRVVGQRRHENL